MLNIHKKWVVKTPPAEIVDEIMRRLNVSRPAAAVLVNRGISSFKEAEIFLYPDLYNLTNPFLLSDIDKAIDRIRIAIDKKEKILVYGDRDVDGVTSISVMVRTLRSLGADPVWYIPSDEGYGVHNEIIERYAKEGISLIITVDCGISAFNEVEYAKQFGIDFVITDHHELSSTAMPEAVAVVNPKRPDSKYPFIDLAGCSVSFKVSEALMLSFGKYYNEEMIAVEIDVTGHNLEISEIHAIGAIKIKNGLIIDKFSADITNNENQDKEVFEKVMDFVGERRFIIQNAEINLGFLNRYIKKYFNKHITNQSIDVLKLASQHYPSNINSISTLAAAMKLKTVQINNIIDKAYLVFEVFRRFDNISDLRMNFFKNSHLDVISLGTIADIMPLIDENRIMVKQGLQALNKSKKVGIQVLLERCINKNKVSDLSTKAVSWNITPILNAAGRRGRADLSAELLLTEDVHKANKLLDEIMQLNSERKELQAENLEKFLPLLKAQCDLENDKIFLVTATGLEHGVTGIIASQIMRQYKRPTILLIIEGEEAMGAARSVDGFDIVAALDKMKDILTKYGGHSRAAGLTMPVDKLEEFRSRLKEIGEKEISPELLVPTVEIDYELQMSEINFDLLNELSNMEPYGMGNPYPIFCLRKVKIKEHSKVGNNGDHLRLKIEKNHSGSSIAAVGWGLGSIDDDLDEYTEVDIAVQLEINVWQDKQSIQFSIQDIRLSNN